MTALHEHDAAAIKALRDLGPETPNWVPPRPGIDHDVAVVGGGQCGIATVFALRQAGIGSVALYDAGDAARPGIWLTRARMHTLRTIKDISGPELHNPALGFRAWFEARHGQAAFEALTRIARTDWAEYLLWFRRIAGVTPRQRTRLTRIEPADDHLRLHLEHDGAPSVETARRVVLATGYPGGGAIVIPELVREGLPPSAYDHTDAEIDFSRFRGRRVAILGAASAAFDNAAAALEAGAAEVRLFCRQRDLQRHGVGTASMYQGVSDNFHHLPDAVRWQLAPLIRARGIFPTPPVVARATRFPNFHIHLAAPWQAVRQRGEHVEIDFPGGRVEVDHVLLATGYHMGPHLRPELADFADQIELWGHRPGLPPIANGTAIGRFPYLGPYYEYRERVPGSAPFLGRIQALNLSALVSFARHVGDIASLKVAVPRAVRGISRGLFLEDAGHHLARISQPATEELPRSSYEGAIVGGGTLEAAE
ncbi:FAD/NAD(P)-binding protein [Xanthobacter sp. V4C-4]|uniref:FAD/NAD(P)-binding protein n=1 Tax=Xanthobacter cornucopiae TaxID=3119924 RepID=UPI0037293FED